MERTIIIAIVLTVEVFVAQLAPAQGTLYLSNLGQTPTGSLSIGSDSWIASSFFTGTNAGGYALNSVQLLMKAASGSPSGFDVSIYNLSSSSPYVPQNSLGSLSGSSNPSAGGLFTYTASDITLLPSTSYFVLVTSSTPIAQGAYVLSAVFGNSNRGSDGGIIDGDYYSSPDGLNWQFSRSYTGQFAIYVTDVPEPSIISLFMLGSGVLIYVRRVFRHGGASIDTDR